MTTFCWLPPLIVVAFMSSALVFTSSRAAHGAGGAVLGALGEDARLGRAGRGSRRRRCATTEASMTRPCLRRSSGMNAIPARIAARGLRGGTDLPGRVTEPES